MPPRPAVERLPHFRSIMRAALLMTAALGSLCAIVLAGVRAQPAAFDEQAALRDFLTPVDGCRAPCIFGITPGITGMSSARRQLETHPWIADVVVDPHRPYQALWRWSGQQPPFVDSRVRGQVLADTMGVVSSVEIQTVVSQADFRLLFGDPDSGTVIVRKIELMHILFYDAQDRVTLIGDTPCPNGLGGFWSTPVILHFGPQFVPLDIVYDDWSARRRWCR